MSSYSSEEYVSRGRSLLDAGKAGEAVEVFDEGSRRFPGDEDLRMGAAMARLRDGNAVGALTIFEELAVSRPRSEEVLEGLVEAALAGGRPDRAREAAREAARAAGRDARSVYRLGRAFYGRGLYAEALRYYELAAEAAPDWGEAWFGLGACEWALRRPAAAEAALRRAVELEPGDWQAKQFLGCALCDMGRKAQAKEMLESVPLDAPWQKPALERLVALAWWPTDPQRRRDLEALWRRVVGGAPAAARDLIEEASRRLERPPA